MRPLLTLAAVLLLPATSFAGQPMALAPAADGGFDIKDGNAAVAHVAVKTAALRRGQPRLRDAIVDGHRIAELRIPVRGTPAEEVWIGEVGGKAAKTLWSGLAGPRDVDGETSTGVGIDGDRVLEFQTASGVTRCDGAPARLFPRAYDFDSGRFRPVMSPLPEPGVEKLVARRGNPAMPAGRPLGGFHWIAASSTRASGSDARSLGSPVELNDGDVATTWAEGTGGDGRGEFVTARTTAGGYAVRGLRIFPGDGASLEAFRGKNRIRKFQIAFGPAREQRFDVEIPVDPAADAAHWRDPFWVPLPKPMPASCATVVVTEVALGKDASPPKSFGTAAIGDLAVFTELDSPDGPERLVADLGDGARLRRAVAAADRPRPGRRAAHRAGGAGREGLRARVPGRGADDARARAQESPRARGAGVRGGRCQRQGGAAGHRRARALDGRARLAAGGAARVGQGGRRRSGAGGARAGRHRRRAGGGGAGRRAGARTGSRARGGGQRDREGAEAAQRRRARRDRGGSA